MFRRLRADARYVAPWGRVVVVGARFGGLILLACAAGAAPSGAYAGQAGQVLRPAAICAPGAARPDLPNSALEQVTRNAEALLARRGGDARRGDDALEVLVVTSDGNSAARASAVAAYCSAAGESMRVARAGSQFQSQIYLIAAVTAAEQARDPSLAALASYRLALATVGGPVIADRRGGGEEPKPAATGVPAAAVEGCEGLSAPSLLARSSADVIEAALACANMRARTAGDAELAALSGLRWSRILLTAGEAAPDPAAAAFRARALAAALQALPQATAIRDPALRIELLGRLCQTAIDAGGAGDPSLERAVAAMRRAAAGGLAGEAYADALQGRVALARGDRAAAQALLRQAVYRESQRPQPLRQVDWLLWLAQAEPARRAEHATAAYRALEAVRPLLPLVDPITEESTFVLHMQPVFEQAVEIQLASHEAGSEDLRIALAQQIVEAYRQAEVQNALGADCVPPREAVQPSELRADEILLYPILLPDRIELIYAQGGPGGTQYRRLPANRTADRATVAALVTELVNSASGEPNPAWRAPARRLYQLLIEPIQNRLRVDGVLVIIPDGPLRALPFAALLDDQDRFLVTRTGISVAPALTYSQPGRDRSGRPLSVVAASLQKTVILPAGYFAKLDGTAEEAQVAAGVGGGGARNSRHITDFQKSDLQAALSNGHIDVLHVATHAAFNGRSDRSFIVADGEAIPMADLRGLITANRARGDELDLLVLSACETAVGDDQASMGLAGAAVQSGARSAIASLWQVNDLGTVELMKQFYSGYRGGLGKAEALREAQLNLIARGGDLAQPGIWAAFALLGGWR